MKSSALRIARILFCSVIFCGLIDRASGQGGTIFINGGTRITDCQTGQLIGDGYTAAIFFAQLGVTDPSLFLQVGEPIAIVNGQLVSTIRSIIGPVQSVNMFGAAWESAAGATYQQASQVLGAEVGRSSIFTVQLGGIPIRIPDFQVCPVPETSTCALMCLGLLGLAIRRNLSRK